MKTFESNIDLFDNIYGSVAIAEITASYGLDDGDNGDVGVYFTVIQSEDVDLLEIYDMKHGRKFIVEGEFLIVCILLGLSLDPMALDPISIADDSIDPVDGDIFGSYTVTMENGKWVDYDLDLDGEGGFGPSPEECKEAIKAVWNTYDEDPDTITVYNG